MALVHPSVIRLALGVIPYPFPRLSVEVALTPVTNAHQHTILGSSFGSHQVRGLEKPEAEWQYCAYLIKVHAKGHSNYSFIIYGGGPVAAP